MVCYRIRELMILMLFMINLIGFGALEHEAPNNVGLLHS